MKNSIGTCLEQMHAAAWSPDGRRFVLELQSGALEIYSPTSLTPLAHLIPHTQVVNAVAWSPDEQSIVSTSTDAVVRVEYLSWWG